MTPIAARATILCVKSFALGMTILLSILGCTSTPTQPNETSIAIRFAETVDAGAARITFADVADSRCPRTVTCVWAGDAAVSLTADSETVVLHTNGTAGPASARLQNATVTLVEVRPERESSDPPQKNAYVAVIRVTR